MRDRVAAQSPVGVVADFFWDVCGVCASQGAAFGLSICRLLAKMVLQLLLQLADLASVLFLVRKSVFG